MIQRVNSYPLKQNQTGNVEEFNIDIHSKNFDKLLND